MRVAHIITGTGVGGAEHTLLALMQNRPAEVDATVISMLPEGELAQAMRAAGVEVHSLDLPAGIPDPRGLARLRAKVRWFRPDVVQTWLYHADLLAGFSMLLEKRRPLVWGIHVSHAVDSHLKPVTRLAMRASARVSHWLPTRIVCCSEVSRATHIQIGYDASKMLVIPNGVDTKKFKPNPAARQRLRDQCGIPLSAPVVMMAARSSREKDHTTAAEAMQLLLSRQQQAHVIFCGEGVTDEVAPLARLKHREGFHQRVHILGLRDDMPALWSAADVGFLSSRTEALPVSLIEAMASGVPCVSTDVGECGLLLGDTGVTAPVGEPDALARACETLLQDVERRQQQGSAARLRVVEKHSIQAMSARYHQLYAFLATDGGG